LDLSTEKSKLQHTEYWRLAQVAWAGVQYATTADAIAMYFAGDNIDSTTPLKLKWAFSSKTHLSQGFGSQTCAHCLKV
jgi:hypothetical protein